MVGATATITRQTDAAQINRMLNHPAVCPWVSGNRPLPLDATPIVQNPNHVVLCCAWGGAVFVKLMIGYYELHTSILPEGRGEGTLAFGRAALEWLFSRTDAVEIVTRVPHGNVAGKAAMRAMGVPVWFTTGAIWPLAGGKVPMDVYKLHILDWIGLERRALAVRGEEFHRRLLASGGSVDHPDDPIHDAHVGAASLLIAGGQPDKAVALYNLYAAMSGYGTISIASRDPLLIDIGSGVVAPQTGEFYRQQAA